MKITAVTNCYHLVKGSLQGFCTVEFDDSLVVKGFRILKSNEGKLFVAYPSKENKKNPERPYEDVVYFKKSSNVWNDFQAHILEEFNNSAKQPTNSRTKVEV